MLAILQFIHTHYNNIEPSKFDILTDYLTVFVDCHDAPLGRAAHSARHAAALSCHRRDCFHLRVGNEKMWELDMILRLKSCNWHSVDEMQNKSVLMGKGINSYIELWCLKVS